MSQIGERITRLCHAYIKLSDKFQKLDIEYMTLRSKVVPLIKALKIYKQLVEQLKQEKQALEEKLQETTLKYEALKPLEVFLQSELQTILNEAEEQVELVETTLHEMESDRDPDLSDLDKELLIQYQNDPEQFALLLDIPSSDQADSCPIPEKVLQSVAL